MFVNIDVSDYFFDSLSDEASGIALTSLNKTVSTSILNMSSLLQDVAIICGVCFVLASLFKFHQHKLNPTQVPISQGVTLLLVGAALTVFPLIVGTVERATFGTANKVEKLNTTTAFSKLIGGQ